MQNDFLVEIRTEELPPKALSRLANCFLQEVETRINKAGLEFKKTTNYFTPRRLAVLVESLSREQPESVVERRGPALSAAYKDGVPTAACIGFARSIGIDPDQLGIIKTSQGEWVGWQQTVPGRPVEELLPALIRDALVALPIPRPMRWGNNTIEFIRPVHSVIMLYGSEVIPGEILGVQAGRETKGHRFHSQANISLQSPGEYVAKLKTDGYVIADYITRKQLITEQAHQLAKTINSEALVVINEDLLDEVANLVEWPQAILGEFDQAYLSVPQEALISAMQDHQRYFPIVDNAGKLMPYFITISNIDSRDKIRVSQGNERVLRARLSDAAFFFETDKKIPLEARVEKLQGVVFQQKLGTLYDKAKRMANLAIFLANHLGAQDKISLCEQAGMLAKADLTTEMVGEFPELQGIAGFYYYQEISLEVATAIKEHYLPRFSGDNLPQSLLGSMVALADRIDTLVGIFAIGQIPTGDKDPFGLRRAALGIVRILIENKISCDLMAVLSHALMQYQHITNIDVGSQVLQFILERLKPWYQEQGVEPDVIAAVTVLNLTDPLDIDKRIRAVQQFKSLTNAESLSVANKRVSNILAKENVLLESQHIQAGLFESEAEQQLASQIENLSNSFKQVDLSYQDKLTELASLRSAVDDFFDHVLVMTDDQARRENRLLLLKQLRTLFLGVADIALLHTR